MEKYVNDKRRGDQILIDALLVSGDKKLILKYYKVENERFSSKIKCRLMTFLDKMWHAFHYFSSVCILTKYWKELNFSH